MFSKMLDHNEYIVVVMDENHMVKKEIHVTNGLDAIAEIINHQEYNIDILTVEDYNDLKGLS